MPTTCVKLPFLVSFLAPSPKKAAMKKVTIAHVSKVISEVYGSRIIKSTTGEQPNIPLQQKLLICTILLMQKESKRREIPVGQVKMKLLLLLIWTVLQRLRINGTCGLKM